MTKKYAKLFKENEAEQGTKEWFNYRLGIPTASMLEAFMSYSKRDGKPLLARKNYLNELAYERAFSRSISKITTKSMEDGIFFEDLAAQEYAKIKTNVKVYETGAYVSDKFAASPDRRVVDTKTGEEYGLEIKTLQDTSFLDIMINGVPHKYYLQIQGQLYATGWDYVDFVAMNVKNRRLNIIRVERDDEVIENIHQAVSEDYELPDINADKLYEFDEVDVQNYINGRDISQTQKEELDDLWF